jgi:hypothetical protein
MKPLRDLTHDQIAALSDDEIFELVATDIEARQRGGPNRKAEHLALARSLEMAEEIERIYTEAEAKPTPSVISPGIMASLNAVYDKVKATKGKSKTEPEVEAAPAPAPKPKVVAFHPSDHARAQPKLPTLEEKQAALTRLAELYDTDPLAYAKERVDWAAKLCTTRDAIDKAVRIERDKQTDDSEQSQATKLVALATGGSIALWQSPDGLGHATVRVGSHWENYRIESTAFDRWLRAEYGRQYTCKIGDKFLPQVPGSAAVRDAISHLEGIAKLKGEVLEPAIRVGGDREVIWIDLGTDDWSAIRVSAEGWEIKPLASVAFVRNGAMLPLPKPIRGGSIKSLLRVVNIREEEFVLVAGWLLQTWCPVGPYAHFNTHGESGEGKTQVCRAMRRTIDPSRYDLRKASKVEDLLIAARNNWVLCFDNMSWISKDWSDTLCMIATGASFGTRRHYTNDEEAAFAAKRAVIFNGIPTELTERSDLASRVVKLEVPAIVDRKTEYDLEEEFLEIWPEVLGALLDGLVGAIRDWRSIKVDKPARMMDFECWAEAGCRAMGFEPDEFVDAYAVNRAEAMAVSAQASAVGRAVMAFLKKNLGGFAGQMRELYGKLGTFKGNANWRDWPKDETRLSTELKRIRKPLEAVGIGLALKVDRRSKKGGGSKDVIIYYTERGHPDVPS